MKSKPAFVKYPEIPHLMQDPSILDSDNLQVFEKIDGGNAQIRTFEGRLLTGNRSKFLDREEFFRFDWFRNFNNWAQSNYSLYGIPENWIVYGEFTSFHTIPYRSRFTNRFFLIDLFDKEDGKFIPYEDSRERLENLGIEGIIFLHPLAKGKMSLGDVKNLALGRSIYSRGGKEGVVVKDYEKQKFAKLWKTSANQTKEGLFDEIRKTIISLGTHSEDSLRDFKIEDLRDTSKGLVFEVYQELIRSGRSEISLADISDTIRKLSNKI